MTNPIRNALNAAQFVFLHKPSKDISGRPRDVLVALIIFIGCSFLVNRSYFSGPVSISMWGLQGFIASLAVSYLVIALASILLRREMHLGATFVIFTVSLTVSCLLVGGIWYFFKEKAFAQSAFLFNWVLGVVPVTVALAKYTSTSRWYHAWYGVFFAVSWILTSSLFGYYYGQSYLLEAAYDAPEDGSYEQWSLPDPEIIYPLQKELLNDQLDTLNSDTGEGPVIYAILGAGTPHQQVFQREIDHLEQLMTHHFNAENRIIKLGPTADEPLKRPLLNRTNLAQSMNAVSEVMDPSQDLVFLFLTSHGSPETISTRFAGLSRRNLSSADIGRAMTESGISNTIVVISSCYSGSFVDELQAPDRLVLTAAAADRRSFGCSDTNTFTDWGTAFFDALDETQDFHQAALGAQATVAIQEIERGYEPSNPQIVEGATIGQALEAWIAARQKE